MLILNSRDYAQSGLGSPTDHPTTLMLHIHTGENTHILKTTHITLIIIIDYAIYDFIISELDS